MKHLFVPYELALLAKEKGFDEPCLGAYSPNIEGKVNFFFEDAEDNATNLDYQLNGYCVAPLYQQLVDWFREKHYIVLIIYNSSLQSHHFHIVRDGFIIKKSEITFNSRNESFNAALTEAFKLI